MPNHALSVKPDGAFSQEARSLEEIGRASIGLEHVELEMACEPGRNRWRHCCHGWCAQYWSAPPQLRRVDLARHDG